MPVEVKEDLLVDGERTDGRKPDEMRPISMEVGVLKRADGSAIVEVGNTRILAAVFGPQEMHPKHLMDDKKAYLKVRYNMAPFAVDDRARPAPSRRDKEIRYVTKKALEPAIFLEEYPKTGIEVQIEVLEAAASTRVTGITAAALALADAGIPMRGLVNACAVGVLEDTPILDVAGVEDAYGKADIPVAMIDGDAEKVTLLQMDGNITQDQFKDALDLAAKGNQILYEAQKKALKKRFEKGDSRVEIE